VFYSSPAVLAAGAGLLEQHGCRCLAVIAPYFAATVPPAKLQHKLQRLSKAPLKITNSCI
jgi:hypothetical protein